MTTFMGMPKIKSQDEPTNSHSIDLDEGEESFSPEWDEVKEVKDTAGNVSKFVFTKTSAVAESVLYKYQDYHTRTVICCSTQSGCPVGCRFCGAGDNFVRNLTEDEIVSQPVHLLENKNIDPEKTQSLQIMFMSMGEPLLNLNKLVPALHRLHALYPKASLLISTSAPDVKYDKLMEVSKEIPAIGLQFSIHESNDEARDKLIPFKKKLTLAQIAAKGEEWAQATGRRPFFNYCVHHDNNKNEDIDRLLSLFKPEIWESTLSVISERDESVAAANQRQRELVENFMARMISVGYSTRMFDPEGQDTIGGGCGQLWYVQEWMRKNPDLARPSIGSQFPKVHTPSLLA